MVQRELVTFVGGSFVCCKIPRCDTKGVGSITTSTSPSSNLNTIVQKQPDGDDGSGFSEIISISELSKVCGKATSKAPSKGTVDHGISLSQFRTRSECNRSRTQPRYLVLQPAGSREHRGELRRGWNRRCESIRRVYCEWSLSTTIATFSGLKPIRSTLFHCRPKARAGVRVRPARRTAGRGRALRRERRRTRAPRVLTWTPQEICAQRRAPC